MFLLRLIKGGVKGLLIGGLVGWALAAAGIVSAGAVVAYAGAALVGVLMALVAGKAIWEKGARIEVGMKALAGGLLLGPGLMWLLRRFVTFQLPFDAALLPAIDSAAGATVATFIPVALALVAAVIGALFDVDNSAPAGAAPPPKKRIQAAGTRIDAGHADEPVAQAVSPPQQRTRR